MQISGDDPDDYKRTLKGQLKRVLDSERDVPGGAAEFVIAYIQAAGADTTSNFLRSSKKVACCFCTLSLRLACITVFL